ncbi:MAG: effector-associated domain EAD1-containing protein [Calothrix sp. MO_167.B42]|nr:effector-associated domain EAD1-containing protein [Calothrix sp. MO_167.B42]
MSNIKELHKVIIKYFDEFDLQKLVDYELNENLDVIVEGKNLDQIVFYLLRWAKSQGKLQQLVEVLCNEKPENELLKKIKNNLFPSILHFAGIEPHIGSIASNQLNNLWLIITDIDLRILTNICKIALENSSKIQDVFGSFPELINPRNLGIFKTILLENNYTNDRDVPSIIEFAERLSKEPEVSQDVRHKLKNWVETLARELNINLPTYEERKSSTLTKVNSYLLVTANPSSTDTFYLQAELIPNYVPNDNNIERIKLELNSDSPYIECSLSDIVDTIYQFISIAKREYLSRGYNLTIEVFLPLQFIDINIDLKDVPIDFDRKRPFGSEYRLLVRSLDRFISNDGEYFNRLCLKWEQFNRWIKNSISQGDIQTKVYHIAKIDDCNWEEIEAELEIEEKFGVKITCCLPEHNLDKEDLFIAIFRGGVPIFLWTRCDLPNVEQEFDKLLNIDFFKSELIRIESVWKLRKVAHSKRDKEKYLGYHLGFLCDNPHRIPFNLMLQNQSLIETGM